jgi:hypothetical protein
VVFGNRNFYWGLDWVKAISPTTVAGEFLTWGPTLGDAADSGDLGWTVGLQRRPDSSRRIVYERFNGPGRLVGAGAGRVRVTGA